MLRAARKTRQSSQHGSSIYEIDQINQILDYVDEDCAVAFDIDDTLYEPRDSYFPGDAWFALQIEQFMQQGMEVADAVEKTLPIYIAAQQKARVKLCEPQAADVIAQLDDKGIERFCLTSRGLDVAEATLRQLQSVGLDFNQGRFEDKQCSVASSSQRGLERGVIFSSGGSAKGGCLKDILAQLDWKPKKLVFIDDKRSYLDSAAAACKELGIEFIGLRYSFMDAKKERIDARIVEVQKQKFLEPILSDEEARAILQGRIQKAGVIFREGAVPVLWCANDFDTYMSVLSLDKDMKDVYRSTPKFIRFEDSYQLCPRFEIPADKLKSLLPKLVDKHLLNAKEAAGILRKLRVNWVGNQPPAETHHVAVVHQFNQYQTRSRTRAQQRARELLREQRPPTQYEDFSTRLRDRNTLNSPLAKISPYRKR